MQPIDTNSTKLMRIYLSNSVKACLAKAYSRTDPRQRRSFRWVSEPPDPAEQPKIGHEREI